MKKKRDDPHGLGPNILHLCASIHTLKSKFPQKMEWTPTHYNTITFPSSMLLEGDVEHTSLFNNGKMSLHGPSKFLHAICSQHMLSLGNRGNLPKIFFNNKWDSEEFSMTLYKDQSTASGQGET